MTETTTEYERLMQNEAGDPRQTEFVTAAANSLAALVQQREDAAMRRSVSESLASLIGSPGWTALVTVLKRWRQDNLEALCSAEGLAITRLQLRAQVLADIIAVVEGAPEQCEAATRDIERLDQEIAVETMNASTTTR